MRAECGEFADDILITALDEVRVLDERHALGAHGSNNHCCACAQITGTDLAAVQRLHAVDNGGLPFYLNVCAHAAKFGGVAEAVVIDALGHKTGADCSSKTDRDLWLHVGREAGIRHGLDVCAVQPVGRFDADGVVIFRDVRADLAQLCSDAVEMLRNDILDQHIAADSCRGRHIGACFDLIGNDGIAAAVQRLDAADLDHVGACAGNLRAHGVQEVRKIHDVRLFGAVFDNRHAAAKHCCEQDVHRRADGDNIEINVAAAQPALRGVGADIAAGLLDHGTHGLEALDMLVNGADTEVAAARHGNMGMTKAAKLCADEVIRRTDASDEFDGSSCVACTGAVDLECVAAVAADLRAHIAQNLQQQPHI